MASQRPLDALLRIVGICMALAPNSRNLGWRSPFCEGVWAVRQGDVGRAILTEWKALH